MVACNDGPLKKQVLVSLLSDPYNFNEKAFRFNLCAFGGDRYICLKAPPSAQDADPQVGIVDMYDDFAVERRTTRKADGAMKHPHEDIMVLRGHNEGSTGQFIQVFDLCTKQRLGEHVFDQDICLWRFIYGRTLVLVSGDEVYHWEIRAAASDPETQPKVLMRREGRMASSDVQVINYCVDDPRDPKWALLAGIYLEEGRSVRGCLQLFSVEKQLSQFLVGYAGCFGSVRRSIDGESTKFFSFVEKKPDSPMKLYVMDIYAPRGEGHPPTFKQVSEFTYPPEFSQDFPIYAHFSSRQGLIFLISKNGHCMLFDAATAVWIHTQRVSSDGIFLAQGDGLTGGIKLINRKGVVMRVYIDENAIIDYVRSKHPSLAESLSERYCYKNSKSACSDVFLSLFASHAFKNAAMICALSKGDGQGEADDDCKSVEFGPYPAATWLRTEETLNKFRAATQTLFSDPMGASMGSSASSFNTDGSPLLQYFTTLLSVPCRLTHNESIELTKAACSHGKMELVRELIFTGRLKCSETVGDLISQNDKSLAAIVYLKARCVAKILTSLIEQKNLQRIYNLITKGSGIRVDFHSLLRQIAGSQACMSGIGKPDYLEMLIRFALIDNVEKRLIDPISVFTIFAQSHQLSYITTIFANLISDIKAGGVTESEVANLETRILEANITSDTAMAEVLFQQDYFKNYDRAAIGRLAERHGIYKRALECYTSFEDQRRVISRAASQNAIVGASSSPCPSGTYPLTQEGISLFVQSLTPNQAIEVLKDLIGAHREDIVIQYARVHYANLKLVELMDLFSHSVESMNYFTGSIMSSCSDPEVHFMYIQTSALLKNWQECERVIRESRSYDAFKLKEYLKTLVVQAINSSTSRSKLSISSDETVDGAIRCLTLLCDINNDIADLTDFLYREEALEYLELYVTRINPSQTAAVIAQLLDLGISNDQVMSILEAVRGSCDVEAVVKVMETRDKLATILPWMEARLRELGWSSDTPASQSTSNPIALCLHNAIAKVYIDRRDPKLRAFLESSNGYDYLIIGKYCANKDPHMAVIAYSRGLCDSEMLALANQNGLFRILAKYILTRENDSLWDTVLTQPDLDSRRSMLDQLLATGILEAPTTSSILCAISALERNSCKDYLLDLLERIIIHKTVPAPMLGELAGSAKLQNLLILTAMQINPEHAQEIIPKLDKIDAQEAASAALIAGSRESIALAIYEKNGMYLEALHVMLHSQHDLEAAEALAAKIDSIEIWSSLGDYCLNAAKKSGADDPNKGILIKKAVQCYTRGGRCADIQSMISLARESKQSRDLITFLKHIRNSASSAVNVDTELALTLATESNSSQELDSLLNSANSVNCQKLGDMLFDEASSDSTEAKERTKLCSLAHQFYSRVPNYIKMTTCLIRLGNLSEAFETAKRSKSCKAFLEVTLAAIDAGEWPIAESSATNVVEFGGDHLDKIVRGYEDHGRYADLIRILESGAKLNIQVLTELGTAYSRYEPLKMLPFLRQHTAESAGVISLNVPKLIKVCEHERQWSCVVLLYLSCDEYDQALNTVLKHSESCWDHAQVCGILQKVTNLDLIYRTIMQVIDERPASLNDMLMRLTSSNSHILSPARLLRTLRTHPLHNPDDLTQSPISLIMGSLEYQQKREDRAEINNLLNDLYVAFHDVEKLQCSIMNYKHYDQEGLAKRLEESELLALNQLALRIYGKSKQYEHAITLAKKFKQYPEAIATAAKSGSSEVTEKLLKYLVTLPPYFAACLQVCAAQVRPEVAIELAWRHKMVEELMPYFIQTIRTMNDRISALEKKWSDSQRLTTLSSGSIKRLHDIPQGQVPGSAGPAPFPSSGSSSFVPL